MNQIEIEKQQMKYLIQYSEDKIPNECCAILLGKVDGESVLVNDIYFCNNSEVSPAHFIISEKDLLGATNKSLETNNDIVCIFHSHPTYPAVPSVTDVGYMQENNVVWIIYSNIKKEAHAFIIEDDMVFRVDIKKI